ncbi:hypothetical protein FRB96_003269 [Tulasnella sp. 330]|nr:hypothetical protein FRB96_003269 [Tulasnella sp. 330]KAG8878204.1 hypothetical protein FRB97_002710 [Tulasnella sp. 331]KAG8883949.1 hypothetical protein FRB98_002730 [Tulasnella sp. 332]
MAVYQNPTPPAYSEENILVSFPVDHVLLITLNRKTTMNAMTAGLAGDLSRVMDWVETETSIWAVIITGSGRAFCAGMDLVAWQRDQAAGKNTNISNASISVADGNNGIGGLSQRCSKKPLIAAVNGFAIGGGLEIVLNCDLVISSKDAKFGYPEASRGVTVSSGGLPRLMKTAGHQLAAEILMTGRLISAQEACDRFRFVNAVVPPKDVLPTAVQWAKTITASSPDAIQSNKRGILATLELGGVEEARLNHVKSQETVALFQGENVLEGLKSFTEKRKPIWVNPKL